MMNGKELMQKTEGEREKLAQDLRAEIRDLRFKIATRQQTKVRALRRAKKDLARVLTAKNVRKMSSDPSKSSPESTV